MKRPIKIILTLIILIIIFVIPAFAGGQAQRYVVVFNSTRLPANAAEIIANAGGSLVNSFGEVGVATAISDNADFAADLEGASEVQSVGIERFQALPDTTTYVETLDAPTGTDDLYAAFQWDIRRVRADEAWITTSGSHDTVVAIIDTGVASNHPDLAPNLVYATCFSNAPSCSVYPNMHWHGTHVAGTVAAAFDGGRAVGVGPNLGLASYNVFELIPECGLCAYDGPIFAAMLDTAAQGFDVINMSLGGYVVFPAGASDVAAWTAWSRVAEYVTRQGVTIVASAGNGNADLNGPYAHVPSDLPSVVSVGSTGIRPQPVFPQAEYYDVRAFYSNYGASVTLTAPGGDCGVEDDCGAGRPSNWFEYLVLSTFVFPNAACAATASCPVGYAWAAGTSMSSPHVAGVAGLVMDLHPRLNPHQVRSILKRSAEDLGDRQLYGQGMVDAAAAVEN